MRRSVPLLLAVLLVLVGLSAPAQASATTGFRFVDITVHDGVTLKANVIEPTAGGLHPAIVFPSSWGLNDLEYLAQAQVLAERGYTVLSYTPRGWWLSGGEIDTAGPADIADASSVLDWLLANTGADPAHIGMAGVSYGAGISLLAAAHDPRVRVVAALSGWTDLVESLYGGQTRRLQTTSLLVGAALLLGDTSDEFNGIIADFLLNRNVAGVKEFARVRSAASYLPQLNASAPAILMANAYGDSIFPPNQLADFFGAYAGPKRLEFTRGDHAIPELTGLAGLQNHVWDSVHRWFDHWLTGADNGIDGEPPVVLRSVNKGSAPAESYPDWSSVNNRVQRYGLGEVSWWTGTGSLGGTPETGWSRRAWLGDDTVAYGGIALVSNSLQALTGEPPTAWLPWVDRDNAGVWISGKVSGTQQIRGIPVVHARVKPSASNGTLVAYLYDVDGWGTGRLISHAPVSWLDAPAGVTREIDIRLPATSWDVPSGHRLALVIDGKDLLYFNENGLFDSALFSGPSWLDLPLR